MLNRSVHIIQTQNTIEAKTRLAYNLAASLLLWKRIFPLGNFHSPRKISYERWWIILLYINICTYIIRNEGHWHYISSMLRVQISQIFTYLTVFKHLSIISLSLLFFHYHCLLFHYHYFIIIIHYHYIFNFNMIIYYYIFKVNYFINFLSFNFKVKSLFLK